MKNKEKKTFKEWYEEHIETIDKVAWAMVGFGIGGIVALAPYYGKNVITSKVMNYVLDDAHKLGKVNIFGAIMDNSGVKPSELGELGKVILNVGGSEDDTWTHFIAIGKTGK